MSYWAELAGDKALLVEEREGGLACLQGSGNREVVARAVSSRPNGFSLSLAKGEPLR